MAIPLPTVLFVTPNEGPTAGGTSVKITGSGFLESATVTIGSVASEVKFVNAEEITANTPAGSGAPAVIVTEEGNSSSMLGPTYTYIVPPTITKVEPAQGTTAGGTAVKITGTNLTGASSVKFGAAEATGVKVESPSEIVATSPAGSGPVNVTVTTPGGTSATSPADEYTYIAPPSVESITPNQGPTAGGTPVTIKGTGFVEGATTVTIGGTKATPVEVVPGSLGTEIKTTTPGRAAGEASVVVEDSNGTSTGGPTYTYIAPPLITLNPIDQVVTAGEDATFMAAASGAPAPSVQWEVSTNGGATWTNDTTDSGNTTDTLTVPATVAQNGDEYRAVFKNVASEATSNPATLTVEYAPVVTGNPASKGVIVGQDTVFTASASGNPAPSVQWQVSTDFEKTWTNDTTDPGSTTSTLTVESATLAENGHEYRAVFSNSVGKAEGNSATLTVSEHTEAPEVIHDPTSTTVVAGEFATFTAEASGVPAPAMQWQVSKNGGSTWTNAVGKGAKSVTLVLEHVLAAQSGNQYRAVFKNVAGEMTSNVAMLTVDTVPVVTANPVGKTVIAGEKTVFTAAASGSPAPAVQWKVSTDGGASWTSDTVDTGNKTDSLTVASTTPSEDGNQYRAVFASSAGSAESNAATLTVDTAPIVTSNPASKVVLAGETATFIAAASGTPAPGVRWEVSNDSGATWSKDTTDPGNNTDTLTVTSTTVAKSGQEYRAVFTNVVSTAMTLVATLTVTPPPTVSPPVLPSPTTSPQAHQPLTTAVAPSPPAPRTMLPFPIVRIAGSIDATGVKISLLTVQAPGGAEIAIRCRGRGCPNTGSRVVASGRRAGTTLVEFRRFERSLQAGAVLEIRISKGGEIGKYTRFTIRRGKPPARVDMCLSPTGIQPIVCPSS